MIGNGAFVTEGTIPIEYVGQHLHTLSIMVFQGDVDGIKPFDNLEDIFLHAHDIYVEVVLDGARPYEAFIFELKARSYSHSAGFIEYQDKRSKWKRNYDGAYRVLCCEEKLVATLFQQRTLTEDDIALLCRVALYHTSAKEAFEAFKRDKADKAIGHVSSHNQLELIVAIANEFGLFKHPLTTGAFQRFLDGALVIPLQCRHNVMLSIFLKGLDSIGILEYGAFEKIGRLGMIVSSRGKVMVGKDFNSAYSDRKSRMSMRYQFDKLENRMKAIKLVC